MEYNKNGLFGNHINDENYARKKVMDTILKM